MNNDFYSLIYHKGNDDILVVNFSSKGIKETNRVMPEMRKTLEPLGCHVAYAIDINKSWYNNISTFRGLQQEINTLQTNINPIKTIFMGLSMGGYGAILFSSVCKCDKVIAFSPQIDIDPKLTRTWDTRYLRYLKNLNITTPHIRNHFKKEIIYELICGDNKHDIKHLALVKDKTNINKSIIGGCGHNPLKHWKEQGKLHTIIKDLIYR